MTIEFLDALARGVEEDLPHVFDRYYQGANGQRRQGLGLGLAFSRAALRAMEGDVEVES